MNNSNIYFEYFLYIKNINKNIDLPISQYPLIVMQVRNKDILMKWIHDRIDNDILKNSKYKLHKVVDLDFARNRNLGISDHIVYHHRDNKACLMIDIWYHKISDQIRCMSNFNYVNSEYNNYLSEVTQGDIFYQYLNSIANASLNDVFEKTYHQSIKSFIEKSICKNRY